MAHVEGPAAAWLASRRDALNQRFHEAQRRFPRLDADAVLAWLSRLLPPLAESAQPIDELLLAVYDLVLLHVGRERLGAVTNAALTPLATLLTQSFPALQRELGLAPRRLTGALSNAVESLGARGELFAQEIAAVGRGITTAEMLLDAGALLAWRLGETRLRQTALAHAATLPALPVLKALGVGDYPAEAAPLLLTSLTNDAWTPPREVLSGATLATLPSLSPDARHKYLRQVEARATTPVSCWRSAGVLAGFLGFNGEFQQPPRLLKVPSEASRHRFWAASGTGVFGVEADCFGWVCRPERAVAPTAPWAPALTLPLDITATSVLTLPSLIAYTTADSFHIRVLAPARERL